MSAGICIMNKTAIALAADSAVTVGNHSAIHNSADKLFSLSNHAPVGAIIYNNASFMQIPFEVIIKEYRKRIGKITFATLKEYVDDFLSYLKNNVELFRFNNNEKTYVLNLCSNLLTGMKNGYDKRIRKKVESVKRELTKRELKTIQKETLQETIDFVKNMGNVTKKVFGPYVKNVYKDDIEKEIKQRFDWLGKLDTTKLLSSIYLSYDNAFYRNGYVGMAIAGYGDSEIFPQMFHIHLGGIINGEVRFRIIGEKSVTEKRFAQIIPLAQTDVMQTFLFGINDSMIDTMGNEITKKLDEKIKDIPNNFFANGKRKDLLDTLNSAIPQIVEEIIKSAYTNYLEPILYSVASLPIDELTSFAESLVSITSARRQVALDDNIGTVGGPIDVAVISKGDGFIWIKRKHYFESKNNLNFFMNNYAKDFLENEKEKA